MYIPSESMPGNLVKEETPGLPPLYNEVFEIGATYNGAYAVTKTKPIYYYLHKDGCLYTLAVTNGELTGYFPNLIELIKLIYRVSPEATIEVRNKTYWEAA